jgi:hypothetical protein
LRPSDWHGPLIDSRHRNGSKEKCSNRLAEGKQVCVFLLALLALSNWYITAVPAFAQVQLPVVNLGDTNFQDGFASPGWLVEEFPGAYVADEIKDANGKSLLGSNHLTSYSTTSHVAYIANRPAFGGWFVAESLLPLADLDEQLAQGIEQRVRGVGDLTVGGGLQWPPESIVSGKFVQRLMLDVGIPTGKYNDARPVNPGNHFVIVNPHYAFTFEPTARAEVSIRAHYLWNSTNSDPYLELAARDTQAGEAFHMNYAASLGVTKALRAGLNGYCLQQLTNSRVNGIEIPRSKEGTIGLGPGIQISGRGIWFRTNGYLETGVRNRPSGMKVTFRISKAF